MPCSHTDITVIRSFGSSFDDHESLYGVCRGCNAYLVSTCHFGGGGHVETRLMTTAEITQYSALAPLPPCARCGREILDRSAALIEGSPSQISHAACVVAVLESTLRFPQAMPRLRMVRA